MGADPGWLLSVDFGTSNTAAAHSAEPGAVAPLPLSHGGNLMPSSVFVESATRIDVGDVALNKAADDPSGFVVAPKRLLTLGHTAIGLGDREVPAHAAVAAIYRTVLIRAQGQHNGRPPSALVLTHPAEWSPEQVRVLVDAAADIGYPAELVRTVPEPVAAAHYYRRAAPTAPGDRIAVFDFGGGTLDVAVLAALPNGTFHVVAARGDNTLGGRNLDAAIRRWVDEQLADRNPQLLHRIRHDASVLDARALDESIRQAKELLSETPSANIDVRVDGLHERLSLTRGELDQLIAPEIGRAIELTRATVALASPVPPRTIYLTGGSSRIPLVHRQLQTLGPVATLDDPKTVVARGALFAVQAPAAPVPVPVPAAAPALAAEPRKRGRAAVLITVGAAVLAAVAVTAVVLRHGGSTTGHAAATTTPVAAAATTPARTETSAAATTSASTAADVRTVLAALPAALRKSVHDCVPAGASAGLDVLGSALAGPAPAGLYSCSISPGDPLLSGLVVANPLSDSNGLTLFMIGLPSDPAAEAADARKDFPTLLENDRKVVALQTSMGQNVITLQYVDTVSGLVLSAGVFNSTDSTRTFLSRAGL